MEHGGQLSNIRQILKTGDHYVVNKQYDNALANFRLALDRLYSDTKHEVELPSIPQLQKSLEVLARMDQGMALDEAPEEIRYLRDKLKAAYPESREDLDRDEVKFVSAFSVELFFSDSLASRVPGSPTERWTIAFHAEQRELFGGLGGVEVVRPVAPSVSFILTLDCDALRSRRATRQMAYAWAHLAQASVTAYMGQYRMHLILLDTSVPLITKIARYYTRALLIDAKYAWALAHLGEVYRDLANGWPGSRTSLLDPNSRVANYIKAIFYFQEAIQQYKNDNADNSTFWARAHMGAALVNSRGFLGSYSTKDWNGLEQWLAGEKGDRSVVDSIAVSLTELFQAQHLAGNYYPWAQAYSSGGMLLKAAAQVTSATADPSKSVDVTKNQGLLSMTMTTFAYYLQPELLREAFDPGALYANSFLEIGNFYSLLKKYSMAWAYALMGMKRLFNSSFLLPGLAGLIGCHLLVHIADNYVENTEEDEEALVMLKESGQLKLLDGNSDLPLKPSTDEGWLMSLILKSFDRFGTTTVQPFLEEDVASDTTITMGLLNAGYILRYFVNVLKSIDRHDEAKPIASCVAEIEKKLKLNLEQIEWTDNYIHENMQTMIATGRLGCRAMSAVKPQ